MIKLYDGGVYLLNGKTLTQSEEEVKALTGKAPQKEEARKGTMAYSILKAHNQSEDMSAMRLKFDYYASNGQICRCTGLQPRIVDKMFPLSAADSSS